MTNVPQPLVDFAVTQLLEKRHVAYLHLDDDNRVIDSGGALARYGITPPQPGLHVVEVFPPAHEASPTSGGGGHIRHIATDNGRSADMHVIRNGNTRWIVLMDSSEEAALQSFVQQKANALRLLETRLAKQSQNDDLADSATQQMVLRALRAAILFKTDDNRFHFRGPPPDWITALWPEAGEPDGCRPDEWTPFLENFLTDAEDCWTHENSEMRWSGVWRENGADEEERSFEAVALNAAGQPVLVIMEVGDRHHEKVQWLQRARENSLSHRRLVKEIEKKDVLLHCIVHDLRSPMISTRSCLELLSREKLSSKGASFLDVGLAELKRQDLLIQTILDAFRVDLVTVDGDDKDPSASADLVECTNEVISAVAPICAVRNVTMELDVRLPDDGPCIVVGERLRLTRVIGNFADNALRFTRGGSTIRIVIEHTGDQLRLTMEDEGPGVAPEFAPRLFDRFARAGARGNSGLGLHFCRITVEGWGGTVGHENRESGGSRFWFTLPQPRS